MLWFFFVAVGSALLQYGSADCGNSSTSITRIINNTADAKALADECSTFWGDIMIGPNSSGDIILNGLTNLTGNFVPTADYPEFSGTQITTLQSQSLLEVGGGINIYTAPMLRNVSFPNIETVIGRIYIGDSPKLKLIDLSSAQNSGSWLRIFNTPSLTSLRFSTGATGSGAGIGITNTSLSSITGFTSTPGGIYAVDNPFLSQLSLQITETVFTGPNNQSLDGIGTLTTINNTVMNVSLPNLSATGGDITLSNCSDLWIPSLNTVNGSFVMNNASFQSFSAPNLAFINGTFNITGSFTGITSFPALYKIAGDVFIQSSQPLDCAPFQQLSKAAEVGGSFFCGGASSPPLTPTATTATTTSVPSSSLSVGAKGGIAAGAVVLGLLVLSGTIFVCFKRKGRNHERPNKRQPPPEIAELENARGWTDERNELPILGNVDHYKRQDVEDSPSGVHELQGK